MRTLLRRLEPRAIEAQSRAFWQARGLPPPPRVGASGASSSIYLLVGESPAHGTAPLAQLQRSLLADVVLRTNLLFERSAAGPMLFSSSESEALPSAALQDLEENGIWFGHGAAQPLMPSDLQPTVQTMVERLAETNVLVSKEAAVRWCPRCQIPRGPGAVVYVDEEGPAYLVRFQLRGVSPPTSALVWTDATWKLLGTSAVLLNPDLSYVLASYKRKGTEERILVSRSSLQRIREWFPDAELEVLEERPGSKWDGAQYVHPLSTEYPALQTLPEPAGTLRVSADVGDSGTGLVTLTPAHGASDAQVARTLHVPGWPVLSGSGLIERELSHKYPALPVDTAEAFILRDLNDGGFIFAQLRVHHGVPRCAECGTALYWLPGRGWMVEPERIDAETLALFGRLLPKEPMPLPSEVVAWPVSETTLTDDPSVPRLAECSACSRVAPPGTGSECPCGGRRTEVRRRLLPPFVGILYSWARLRPFPKGESVWMFVPDRRRAPLLTLHLVAMFAVEGRPRETRLTLLPSLAVAEERAPPGDQEPLDALRTALVRLASPGKAVTPLGDRLADEARRLRKFWRIAESFAAEMVRDEFAAEAAAITAALDTLPEEDRAFLSRFERLRIDLLSLLSAGRFPEAFGRLARFVDTDLRLVYLPLIRPRLDEGGLPASKVAAYRVLTHVILLLAELWSPFAPHTMEAIYRAFRDDGRSLFESPIPPVQQVLVDAAAEKTLDAAFAVVAAVDRARRRLGLPSSTRWKRLLLNLREDAAAAEIRAASALIARLTRSDGIEVTSPGQPWEGRSIAVQPNLAEIQRLHRSAAGRIVKLLDQMPGRRVKEGLKSQSLSVVLDGQPVQILPSMVELTESVPPGFIAIPWDRGEIYLALPEGSGAAAGDLLLDLSLDGYRLVRAARRRLERRPPNSPPAEIWVEAKGPLADELSQRASAVLQLVGATAFRVVPAGSTFVPAETTAGRTARGSRWRVWIPGLKRPGPRTKRASRRARGLRVPRAPPLETDESPGPDYLSDEVRSRDAEIRATLEQVDSAVGLPIMGPSKLAAAWEAGIHGFQDLTRTPFDRLAPLPGFGPYVAREVLRHFGGTVPDRIWVWPTIPVDRVPVGAGSPETDPDRSPPVLPETGAFEPSASSESPAATPVPERLPRPTTSSAETSGISRESPPSEYLRRAVPPPLSAPQVPPPPREPLPPWQPPLNAPVPEARARVYSSRPGITLLLDTSTDPAWEEFLQATESGRRGLCVTREFPDRLRRRIGARDVTVIWLSNVGRQSSIRPSDLGALENLFQSALADGHVSAILIEGLEYLATVNSIATVMKLLRALHAEAERFGATVWVPVNPALIHPNEVELLKLDFASRSPAI